MPVEAAVTSREHKGCVAELRRGAAAGPHAVRAAAGKQGRGAALTQPVALTSVQGEMIQAPDVEYFCVFR